MNVKFSKPGDMEKVHKSAISLCVWLINEKKLGIHKAVSISSRKYNCQKAPLERLVRDRFPSQYFETPAFLTKTASKERIQNLIEKRRQSEAKDKEEALDAQEDDYLPGLSR
jgi:hypothetical protein